MTDQINEGGPAFPWCGEGGLTKREVAAIAAVASGIDPRAVRAADLQAWFGDRSGITDEEIIAAKARRIADALLAELAKGAGQ